MRVAAQIAECVFGSAERALGIHHPIGAEQWAEPGGERLRCLKVRQRSMKSQFALAVKFAKAGHEFAAENAAEDLYGQEETGRCGDQRWWSGLRPPAGTTQ